MLRGERRTGRKKEEETENKAACGNLFTNAKMHSDYDRTNATHLSMSMDKALESKEKQAAALADKKRSVAAVILASTFGNRVLHENIAYAKNHAILETPMHLQGRGGAERVPLHLQPFGEQHVLESLVKGLRSVRRIEVSDIFVVCNEADKVEVLAWAKTKSFNAKNIISNGCLLPSEEKTDIEDLQLAIRTFNLENQNLVVMNASSGLFPGYTLQPVVEHSIILGRDVVGYLEADDKEGLLPHDVLALEVNPLGAPPDMPKVEKIYRIENDKDVAPGTFIASGYFLLRRPTVQSVLTTSEHASLGDFMIAHVKAGEKTSGVAMGWGHLHIGTLASFLYTESLMFYLSERAAMRTFLEVNADTLTNFRKDYFGDQTANIRAKIGHKLPTTFYMTAYRNQMMHGGVALTGGGRKIC